MSKPIMIGDGYMSKLLKQSAKSLAKSTAVIAVSGSYLYVEHEYKKARKIMEKIVQEEQKQQETPQEPVFEYIFYETGVKVIKKALARLLDGDVECTSEELREYQALRDFIEWMTSQPVQEEVKNNGN
jgi:hypothetical protein